MRAVHLPTASFCHLTQTAKLSHLARSLRHSLRQYPEPLGRRKSLSIPGFHLKKLGVPSSNCSNPSHLRKHLMLPGGFWLPELMCLCWHLTVALPFSATSPSRPLCAHYLHIRSAIFVCHQFIPFALKWHRYVASAYYLMKCDNHQAAFASPRMGQWDRKHSSWWLIIMYPPRKQGPALVSSPPSWSITYWS